jgi:putative ABC transport system permease protein
VRVVIDVSIGPWGLGASLLLVLLAVVVSLTRHLGLERDLLVAVVRSIGQLLLAGWALRLILDQDTHMAWAWLWAVCLVPFAAATARRREPRLRGLGWMTAAGYTVGLGVSLAVVFGLGVLPLEARVLVPVSGMIVGNSLKVVVVAAARLVDGVRDRSGEIEAMLGLGFGSRRAVRDVAADALRLALLPQIEITRSVGMVFIPGALTGLVLAGVDPVDAAMVQAALLFLILGSAAITGLVVVLLGAGRFFTADQRLEPPAREGG